MVEPTALRFTSPPVRTVRLAYFFTTEEPLLAVHATSVYQAWKAEYPVAKELAPRAPINGEAQDFQLLTDPHHWPIPFVEFEGPQSQRRIFFQSDRFGLSWTFGDTDDAREYPGFDELSRELEEKFAAFTSAVVEGGAGAVLVTGAECAYKNELVGLDLAQYVTGLLTEWKSTSPTSALDPKGSASFSRHLHHRDDASRPLWIRAESTDIGTSLRITSRIQETFEQSGANVLRAAHDVLIDAFIASTSDAMRQSWGPQ